MKYIQLFVFPILLSIYGLFFAEKREGYQMIVGSILTIIAVGGSILTAILAYVLRKQTWLNNWYARIGLSALGCILTFALLYLYVQLKDYVWVDKTSLTTPLPY